MDSWNNLVDIGDEDIVNYLLDMEEELGMNVNAAGTPLNRALEMKSTSKPSRFEELHRLLATGLMKEALPLLEYFSDEELSTDKTNDQWALHTIHPSAFVDKAAVEYTKKLILEYVRRGWDPNSVSSALKCVDFGRWDITIYNLLHLACIYNGQEIIKLLVENLGVDMERKLEGPGQLELTSFLILLNFGRYTEAEYLMEKGADINVRGKLPWPGNCRHLYYDVCFLRTRVTDWNLKLNPRPNAVELLIKSGSDRAMPLFEKLVARPDVILQGAYEFHLALDGSNPVYVATVLKRCVEMISQEDLNWVTAWHHSGKETERVPSLVWHFEKLLPASKREGVGALAHLVKLMVQLGYELNPVGHQSSSRTRSPLIFYILRYDLKHQISDLTRTILQFDHLQLNVTDMHGRNPVESLLYEWDESCGHLKETASMCRETRDLQQPPILETIKLLLAHGLDVSGMVIDSKFAYHRGFNLVLKLLCNAGAKISEKFWATPQICWRLYNDRAAMMVEIGELKDDFDRKTGLSLKQISGLQVRKMLNTVGDLKMLDGLPRGLKETVLGTGNGLASLTRDGPKRRRVV